MYVLTELGFVLIPQVKEKEKKCSFENALVKKSKSSTRNKKGLVEGLLLFSIQMFTFTDLSRYVIKKYNFLFSLKYLCINVFIVNTRSAVLKPLRKPIWLFFTLFFSLIRHSSLLFRRRLKSLLRQLLIVMSL